MTVFPKVHTWEACYTSWQCGKGDAFHILDLVKGPEFNWGLRTWTQKRLRDSSLSVFIFQVRMASLHMYFFHNGDSRRDPHHSNMKCISFFLGTIKLLYTGLSKVIFIKLFNVLWAYSPIPLCPSLSYFSHWTVTLSVSFHLNIEDFVCL